MGRPTWPPEHAASTSLSGACGGPPRSLPRIGSHATPIYPPHVPLHPPRLQPQPPHEEPAAATKPPNSLSSPSHPLSIPTTFCPTLLLSTPPPSSPPPPPPPQDPTRASAAEQVLLQFRHSPRPLPACRHLLDHSPLVEARFHAACTLREALVREWAVLSPEEVRVCVCVRERVDGRVSGWEIE
jgi:hypothetical protein